MKLMTKTIRVLIGMLIVGAAVFAQNTPVSSVLISTTPSGARFYVDGLPYISAQIFLWPQGSKHTLQFPTEAYVNGASAGCQISQNLQFQYCFTSWTNSNGSMAAGSAPDQSITASPSITWIRAEVRLEYKLRVRFMSTPVLTSPECAAPGNAPQDTVRSGLLYVAGVCLVGSADMWSPAGAVMLNAYAFPGFIFTGWSINGQVFDSFLTTYTVTGPVTIFADFEPAKRVRFETEPLGLKLLVDRTSTPTLATESLDKVSDVFPPCKNSLSLPPMPPITVPALCFGEFDFLPGSKHVIGAVSPQIDSSGKYWVFDRFDNGLEANSVYIPDSNTGTANKVVGIFVHGMQAAFLTNPSGLKLSVDGRDNWPNYNFIWAENSKHVYSAPATQVDSNGRTWTFQGWSNGGPPSQTMIMDSSNANVRMVANYTSLGQVRLLSNPPGIKLQVDGVECSTPCSFDRNSGSQLMVIAPPTVPVDSTSRLDFLGWSDGAPASRTFTLNGDAQTVSANYGYSYRLSTASDPEGGVDFLLNPPSSDMFYPADSQVVLTAVVHPGFRFRRWSGDLGGTYNSGQLTLTGPRSVVASLDRVPYISPAGIKNAAGDTPDGSVAPGSIISIYGESLAPQLLIGPRQPLAQTIADVVVTVGDRILPLIFVSPKQINAQVSSDLADGAYTLTVHWTGKPDVTGQFKVSGNAPGLFSTPVKTELFAAAVHEDGAPVTLESPARKGELITLYGTGFGPYSRKIIDGFTFPIAPPVALLDTVDVNLGGVSVPTTWSGGVPDSVGLVMTRFRLPDDAASQNLELSVKVNGKTSNVVLLPVE